MKAKKQQIRKKPVDEKQKFDKILKQVDTNLDEIPKDPKQAIHQFMNKQNEQQQQNDNNDDMNQDIGIQDFLKKLETQNDFDQTEQIVEKDPNSNQQLLKKQLEDMQKNTLLAEPEYLAKQEENERKANYSLIKKDMSKWIPIIKRNREAQHLNFTQQDKIDNLRVNTVMGTDLSHPIAKEIEGTLKSNQMESETAVKQKEKVLNKEQVNLLKEKNLLFFKELKHKRVAKIKSKMYHKIKNKKKQKEASKNPEEVNLQQLEEEQIRERIQQRHKTKGKNLRNLMKYGDKKSVQQTVTANADMRKQILQKIMHLDHTDPDDYDSDDDTAFREKAIKELEKELTQDIEKTKKTGLSFLDTQNEKQRNQAIEEAQKLLEKLKKTDDYEAWFSDEEMAQMDEEEEEHENAEEKKTSKKNKDNKKNEQKQKKEEDFEGRKVYRPDQDEKKKGEFEINLEDDDENDAKKKHKKQDAEKIMKNYLKNEDEKEQQNLIDMENEDDNDWDIDNNNNDKKEKKQKKELTNDPSQLVENFNVKNLSEKYKKQSETTTFNKKDLELFDIENKDIIYKNMENFNILVDDDNEKEFMKDKYDDYQAELPEEQKKLDGWGSWTGQGVVKKPEISEAEKAEKKRILIEKMKKQRSDGQLDNVIKRDSRNKLVTQYYVKELPHPYNSKEQFNFMNNTAIGPEWNTLKSTQKYVQPKIKTKVGQIIKPIKAPKRSGIE